VSETKVSTPGRVELDRRPDLGSTRGRVSDAYHSQGRALWIALLLLCALLGLYAHIWYASHEPVTSDQAIVGMIAQNILRGHFSALYWGQSYGGVEPYVVAAVSTMLGTGYFALDFTPILLMAIVVIVTWRVALRLVGDPWLAALSSLLVWITPAFDLTSAEEVGFRTATMVCGMFSLLFALRILDGRRRYVDMVGLGLSAGVAWWASPESIYFLLPSALLLIGAVVASEGARRLRFWIARLATIGVSSAIGALPWLWSNVPNGFRSLNPGLVSSSSDGTYLSRVGIFFDKA
jgi:hypothetical protein